MSLKEPTEFEALLQDLRLAQIELKELEEYYFGEKTFWLSEINKTEKALRDGSY